MEFDGRCRSLLEFVLFRVVLLEIVGLLEYQPQPTHANCVRTPLAQTVKEVASVLPLVVEA